MLVIGFHGDLPFFVADKFLLVIYRDLYRIHGDLNESSMGLVDVDSADLPSSPVLLVYCTPSKFQQSLINGYSRIEFTNVCVVIYINE